MDAPIQERSASSEVLERHAELHTVGSFPLHALKPDMGKVRVGDVRSKEPRWSSFGPRGDRKSARLPSRVRGII